MRHYRPWRGNLPIGSVLLLLLALLVMLALLPAQAQNDQRCFSETGHCIDGRIREYWEQNGGLPVFGYPISAQRPFTIEGQPIEAQWFERNRLELHPQNEPPYDVLLGRLGVDVLEQQGRDWFTFPREEPQVTCRYFAETQQNVCGDILAAWQANGLELGDPGISEAESLALSGMPLSPVQEEEIDGQSYQVQWFERTRYELHPENDPPYHVLLGLLGNEVRGSEHIEPIPTIEVPGTITPTVTTTPGATPTPEATPTTTPVNENPTQHASDWSVVVSMTNRIDLKNVFMVNAREAWMVGNDPADLGVIYRALWDGAYWNISQQFATTEPLHALAFISPNNIWAVGDNGLIIHKDPQDGRWSYVDNPVPDSHLRAIQMFGAGDTGFAGGWRELGDGEREVVLLRYEDEQWERVGSMSGPGFISSMHFAPGAGWAVGSDMWRYRDGDGWSKDESLPPPCEGDSRCYRITDAVHVISAEEAWVVGNAGVRCFVCTGLVPLALHYIDGAWQQSLPGEDNPVVGFPGVTHAGDARRLYSVSFATSNHALAVGMFVELSREERGEPVRQGLILRYLDGTWYYEPVPPIDASLHSVSMADEQHALAVGDNGLILSYGYDE